MTLNKSHNDLSSIPESVFINNNELHVIDLSGNKITDVTFEIKQLLKLNIFDLRDNYIFTLGLESLGRLNGLFLFSNVFL